MNQDRQSLSHGHTPVQGLLLAGGRGLRFDPQQKRHKLLERLPDGQTLIEASARRLLPWVDALTVVVGAHNVGVVRELSGLPVRIVVCPDADSGPGASLHEGLLRSEDAHGTKIGAWLIALADMPWVGVETYRRVTDALVSAASRGEEGIWQPRFEGKPGHPVGVTPGMVTRYLTLSADLQRGLSTLWRRDPDCLHILEVADAGCVQDVDVPSDLASGLSLRIDAASSGEDA